MTTLSLQRFAFNIGRRIGKHPMSGRIFCSTERFLPLKRIVRENGLVAFHHPRPIASHHVLIAPTHPAPSLITDHPDESYLPELIWEMVVLARRISADLDPTARWQFVINGGERQDIGQIHGHLLRVDEQGSTEALDISAPAECPQLWVDLFRALSEAASIPLNGFSLVFRWEAHSRISVILTQSMRTY